jgi:DNA-binding transcriptional LysR family regulator
MNSAQLKVFLMIVDQGSLTKAANELCRTQSAISIQLRKLEERAGVPLFDRHAQGMSVNCHGLKLIPYARKVLNELEQANCLFSTKEPRSIRIGFPDDFDDTILESILADFSIHYPHVELITRSGCTSNYELAVRKSELDIAVCNKSHSDLGQDFSCETNVWVSSLTASLECKKVVPLALMDRECSWCKMPIEALDTIGRPWKVVYSGSSFTNFEAAIRAGIAIGVMPLKNCNQSMKQLSKAQGFPELPKSRWSIVASNKVSGDLASFLKKSILTASHILEEHGTARFGASPYPH